MAAPDELLYEYSVVRYVPRIDREEFINIGLVMLCKRRKWLHGKIEFNEPRLYALDPYVRLKVLKEQAKIFEKTDLPFPDLPVEERYRWLTASKSAVLQASPSHPGIILAKKEKETAESLLLYEFNRLFSELVKI